MLPRLTSDNEKERLLTFEFHIARFIYMHGITTSVSFIEINGDCYCEKKGWAGT